MLNNEVHAYCITSAVAGMFRFVPFVPLTADQLLAKKKGRELLQGYDERAQAAVRFVENVHPASTVVAGALVDPNIPPAASTDPDFDGIVVSEETISGAEAINAERQRRGFDPLVIVVVGLVKGKRDSTGKLSSTDLRLQA